MKIEVTADDIDNGTHQPDRCPVALAIGRHVPDKRVHAWEDLIYICYDDESTCRHFDTPYLAAEFIKRFDDQDDGSPFEFELAI